MKQQSAEKETSPTAAESKIIQDKKEVEDWGSGKGIHTPAFSGKDKEPTLVQLKTDKAKMVTNTAGEVAKELEKEKADELVKPHAKADSEKDSEPTLVQLDTTKAKMVTNTAGEVAKELEKEKADELIKPHSKADSEKDTEPTNVLLKEETKKWTLNKWSKIDTLIVFKNILP